MSEPIPTAWTSVRLGDLIGKKVTRNPRKDGSSVFQYIDVDALDNKRNLVDRPKVIPSEEAPSRARRLVRSGDVLFSLVRPYLRNIAIVPDELDAEVASTAYCVLSPRPGCDSRFLFYQVLGDTFVNSVPTYGNSPPSAREDEFLNLHVLLAPECEQRRIVAKIEELFSELDAGTEALKRAQAKLERYRASVLKAAVEGKLTEQWRKENPAPETGQELLERILVERRARWEEEQLAKYEAKGKKPPKNWQAKYKEPAPPDTSELPGLPEGWCWGTIDELSSLVRDGEHHTPERAAAGVLLLSARNVRNGLISLQNVDYVPEAEFQRIRVRLEPVEGDVLLSCSGSVGRSCTVPPGLRFGLVRSVAVIRPVLVSGAFVSYMLRSPYLQSRIDSAKSQTAQANIFQKQIRSLPIPVPPIREQEAVVEHLDHSLTEADRLGNWLRTNTARSLSLRKAILKRAFEGRLVPQDPDDEPASALLERIRAQREAETPKKKARKKKTPQPELDL